MEEHRSCERREEKRLAEKGKEGGIQKSAGRKYATDIAQTKTNYLLHKTPARPVDFVLAIANCAAAYFSKPRSLCTRQLKLPRIYAFLFLVELVLRVLAEGCPFFWSSPNVLWNYLDA